MQYILNKVFDDEVKQSFEKALIRYLKGQLKTMPRIFDDGSGLKERFANLQKLLGCVEDLPNKFSWEKKKSVAAVRKEE